MSETVSFWSAIQRYRKVQIPKIQRDYIQGRPNDEVRSARDDLLADMRSACLDRSPMSLNVVYGEIKAGIGGNSEFESRTQSVNLLDGQQRFTTLYLLHWYALLQSSVDYEKPLGLLNRFTYETRSSSRDFFEAMTKKQKFESIREAYAEFGGVKRTAGHSLAEVIRDKHWFRPQWDLDPTIISALDMLDCLENSFCDIPQLWQLLTSEECPVCFKWLDVRGLGNPDELYIKMNARGKQLNQFERFKVELEKAARGFFDQQHYGVFSQKIDNRWIDFFWRLSVSHRNTNAYSVGKWVPDFEERFMAFLHWALWNRWCEKFDMTGKSENSHLDSRIDGMQKVIRGRRLSDYEIGIPEGERIFDEIFVEQLSYVLDYVSQPDANPDIVRIIDACTNSKATNSARYQLQAVFSYFSGVEGCYSSKTWLEWWRVASHLNDYARRFDGFNTIPRYAGWVKGMCGLAPFANGHLLEALAKGDVDKRSFRRQSHQIEEECLKARLMCADESWVEPIFEAESIRYFWGSIGFLLDFAGIYDEETCDTAGADELSRFKEYTRIVDALYDEGGLRCDSELFRRALLTKGDFSLPMNSLHSYIGDSSDKREVSWEGFFREDYRDWYLMVRDLLDDLLRRGCESNTDECLRNIVEESEWDESRSDWWAKPIIEIDGLIGEFGKYRQVKELRNWWGKGLNLCLLPTGGNVYSNGFNKELHLASVAVKLRARGINAKYYRGMLGEQPGNCYIIEKDGEVFELGITSFGDDGPLAITRSGEDAPLFTTRDERELLAFFIQSPENDFC